MKDIGCCTCKWDNGNLDCEPMSVKICNPGTKKYYQGKTHPATEGQSCGSCVKFKYENIDGDGVCGVSDFAKRCDEGPDCKFHKAKKK